MVKAFEAENVELKAQNRQLQQEMVQLEQRIAELERRLGLSSGNSCRPRSSDGLNTLDAYRAKRNSRMKYPAAVSVVRILSGS